VIEQSAQYDRAEIIRWMVLTQINKMPNHQKLPEPSKNAGNVARSNDLKSRGHRFRRIPS